MQKLGLVLALVILYGFLPPAVAMDKQCLSAAQIECEAGHTRDSGSQDADALHHCCHGSHSLARLPHPVAMIYPPQIRSTVLHAYIDISMSSAVVSPLLQPPSA